MRKDYKKCSSLLKDDSSYALTELHLILHRL